MRSRGLVGMGLCAAIAFAVPAWAAESERTGTGSEETDAAVARPAPPPKQVRRARTADPWLTRATLTMIGASATTDARIPVGDSGSSRFEGTSQAGGLAIDLYGRWIGFDLALIGAYGERRGTPADEADASSLTAGEARASLTGVIWNSRGVFVAAGPSIEGRATAFGDLTEGNEGATSWQTAFAGAGLQSRVFFAPYLYATGHVFAAVTPVGGAWQSVDATTMLTGDELVRSGALTDGRVIAGSAALSLRPVESLALSGGVAWRNATYTFEGNRKGSEESLRPFIGLELLY